MRVGILIVGSLFWRQSPEREQWRQARLLVDQRLGVQAPIYYGRLSESGTYTMTFGGQGDTGRAVLVPCRAAIRELASVVAEAKALWAAEFSSAEPDKIGARRGWGCVGAAFRQDVAQGLANEWKIWFRDSRTQPVAPVDLEGILQVPWPREAEDSDVGVLLATSTKAERQRPTPQRIAEAWMLNGGEDYFFRNVENDIRTPDDLEIWREFQARGAECLNNAAYARAFDKLRAE